MPFEIHWLHRQSKHNGTFATTAQSIFKKELQMTNLVETTNPTVSIDSTPSINLRGLNANVITDDKTNFSDLFEVEGVSPTTSQTPPNQTKVETVERVLPSVSKTQNSKEAFKYLHQVSLEAATADETNLVPKQRSEYVTAFKLGAEKTARATLEMCRVVYEAKQCLDNFQFGDFCKEVGFKDYSSAVRKMVTIGKLYPRFIQYADQLPSSWTNIYLITQIPADVFEECIQKKFPLIKLTGAKLTELVNSTKDINRVETPMSFDSPNGGYTIGKVLFTSMPDETDWRAMEKAFNELSARLPIKFVVNKEVQDIVDRRRDQRYKNSKKHYEHIELKPDLWDLGAEANAVYKTADKVSESDNKAVITV